MNKTVSVLAPVDLSLISDAAREYPIAREPGTPPYRYIYTVGDLCKEIEDLRKIKARATELASSQSIVQAEMANYILDGDEK